MKSLPTRLAVPLLCVFSVAALRHSKYPTPPPSLDHEGQAQTSAQTTVQQQVDLAELQREADDLARTAQTIPMDMESVRKGTLPKDFIQKLKQIEKLSKHLRSQVSP